MNTPDPTSAPQGGTEGQPQAGTYTIHVDGSSLRNPGPAGWAVVVDAPDGTRRVLAGSAAEATNNQMELWAAYTALYEVPAGAEGVVYTDSSYVVDGITKWRKGWARRGWRKADGHPVANGTFWQILSDAADQRPHVRFVWVKGHNGNTGNELADRLARTEAEKVRSGLDPVGGCGVILEDCAEEDAERNLRWMNAREIRVEAA